MTRRKEIDHTYQQVGNASTWERYVTFGYHVYDHCIQFETEWERMQENEMDAKLWTWVPSHLSGNRALDMPTKLER